MSCERGSRFWCCARADFLEQAESCLIVKRDLFNGELCDARAACVVTMEPLAIHLTNGGVVATSKTASCQHESLGSGTENLPVSMVLGKPLELVLDVSPSRSPKFDRLGRWHNLGVQLDVL